MSVEILRTVVAPPEDPDAKLSPPPDPAEGQDIVPETPHENVAERRREGVVSDPDARPDLPRQ